MDLHVQKKGSGVDAVEKEWYWALMDYGAMLGPPRKRIRTGGAGAIRNSRSSQVLTVNCAARYYGSSLLLGGSRWKKSRVRSPDRNSDTGDSSLERKDF